MAFGAMSVMTCLEWMKPMLPAGALIIQMEPFVMPPLRFLSAQVQINLYEAL